MQSRKSQRLSKLVSTIVLASCASTGAHAASSMDARSWEEMRRPPHPSTSIKADRSGGTKKGTPSNDAMTGFDGEDRFLGLGGNDGLDGGAGDDELDAGEGDDWLRGGAGDDTLRGGGGNDRYEFAARSGVDRVEDTSGLNTIMILDTSGKKMQVTHAGGEYVIAYGDGSILRVSNATFATLQFLSLKTLLTRDEFLQIYGIPAPAQKPTVAAPGKGDIR